MSRFACCHEGCAHFMCFDDDVEERLRQTHEWFYCPVGHPQRFSGKTKQEKRIEELERDLKSESDRANRILELWEEALVGRDEARIAARTCPLCGTRFRTPRRLPEHLAEAHGAVALVVEEQAVTP